MSDKTPTAVQWLIAELNKTGFAQVVTDEEIAQALERDRQQSEYFFECGRNFQVTGENTFIEVYAETFKP